MYLLLAAYPVERRLQFWIAGERLDFPELLPQQFFTSISGQALEERVQIHDFTRIRVGYYDAVLCRLEQTPIARFGSTLALGDILHGKQDRSGPAVFLDPASVQKHRPGADSLEIALEFDILDAGSLPEDVIEQIAQFWKIELPAPHLVDGSIHAFLG